MKNKSEKIKWKVFLLQGKKKSLEENKTIDVRKREVSEINL